MGQYYEILIGDKTGNKKELYNAAAVMMGKEKEFLGAKLLEHGLLNEPLAIGLGRKLMDSYHRVIWVGDYANGLTKGYGNPPEKSALGEPTYYDRVRENVGDGISIPSYEDAWSEGALKDMKLFSVDTLEFIDWKSYYLINKEKKQYLDLDDYIHRCVYQWGRRFVVINPLALLTAVGNGLGNGDYCGEDIELVGSWAWNLIGLSKEVPDGYTKIMPWFNR